MKLQHLLIVAVGLLAGLAATSDAQAQYNPYFRPGAPKGPPPPVSPYLNLLRGNNTAVNYYLGVQPAINQQMLFSGQMLLGDDRRVPPPEAGQEELFPRLAGTGHPAVFQNYGGYFNNPNPALSAGQQPAAKTKRQ